MNKPFIFGGDTDMTYEDLRQRQKYAAGMVQKGSGSPKTTMDGLNSAANSVLGALLSKRLGEKEAEGREAATSTFQGLIGQNGTPTFSTSTNPAAETPPAPTGQGGTAAMIKQGLVSRGLPDHIADAFVLNFQDESGLDPSINEANPTVAGSRGGFGLSQWTGPRRRELEQYAATRGVDVADPNLQLDFLMTELRGSESGAARAIMSTKNTGDAAAAIVNKFLRPAETHRAARVARYTGGATPNYDGYQAAGSAQQAVGVNPDLLDAMSNPYMTNQQQSVLGMLMQRQMSAGAPVSPMEQLQMERLQLQNHALRNPKEDPMAQVQLEKAQLDLEKARAPTERNIVTGADGFQYYQDDGTRVLPNIEPPSAGYAQLPQGEAASMGLDPSRAYQRGPDGKISAIGGGGTSVTVNSGDSRPNIPDYNKLPAGYVYQRGPDGQIMINDQGVPTAAPIVGGPKDTTEQDLVAQTNRERSGDVVLEDIDRILTKMGDGVLPETGFFGQVLSKAPGTDAHDVKQLVQTVRANVGFDRLQQMRDASKTGGALGAINQTEMDLLTSALGSLEQSQTAEQFKHNLTRLKGIYGEIVHGKQDGNPQQGGELSFDELKRLYGG